MKLSLTILSIFFTCNISAVDYKLISCQGDALVINESIGSRGGHDKQLVIMHDEINQNLLSTSISSLFYGQYSVSSSGMSSSCFSEIPNQHYHGWYQSNWCFTDYSNKKNIWIGYNSTNRALFMEFYHRNSHIRSTDIYVEDCHYIGQEY